MQQNDTLQILMICESQPQLEAILGVFRNAGVTARANRVASLRDLGEILRDNQSWDLLIANEVHPELTPGEALALLKQQHSDIPCIVRAADAQGDCASQWLREGARDVVALDNDERLIAAARREISAVRALRELGELRIQYQEIAQRCELLLAASRDAIAYVVDGMHVHANELYAEQFGFTDIDELASVPLVDLIAPQRQKEFKDALKRYRANPEAQTLIDCAGIRTDGSEFPGQLVLSTASFEGEPCMQVMVRAAPAAPPAASPATARLSGVEALRTALSASTDGTLLLFAIDDYKQLCRSLGITAANSLVQQLGDFIVATIDSTEPALRVADSVLAICLHSPDLAHAEAAAKLALEALAGQIHETGRHSASCSATVVICPLANPEHATLDDLIDQSWSTMLGLAEDAGRLRVTDAARITTIGGSGAQPAEGGDGGELEQALHDDAFRLLFQPIVSLRGDSSEYYEVQVEHKPSGRSAAQWLQETTQPENTAELDQWVISESLQLLGAHRMRHPETRLLLPIGIGSLLDADFATWLAAALRTSELPAETIGLQIPHAAVHSCLKQAKLLAERLHALGCPLAVSEVHTASNPMADLLHLKPQFARIDRSLTEALKDSDSTNTLLKPLIESLHHEQIASIMPNVESAAVLAVLWQLGINFIEGDYLQPPLPEMRYDFTDLA